MIAFVLAFAGPVDGQERLCDNSFEDCRAPILELIRNERVGIDVSYWFMTDQRYSNEIIRRWQAGVPVRVILDTRADGNYPANAHVRSAFRDAGIPIRRKYTAGIHHWKAMIFAGQRVVQFSAANYANGSFSPIEPYTRYVDEAIYFSDDSDIVHSFMRRFEDLWSNTSHYTNYANVTSLARRYPVYPVHPDLNFAPSEHYENRLIQQIRAETERIDAVMFRITSGLVPTELIQKVQSGVPVRLITDRRQYRNTSYFWHAYNIDRMHAAGIPVKWKRTDSGQDMHQKSVLLYSRGMAVFGSSNWTASSSTSQQEHNYFSRKGWMFQWFREQFGRKWLNRKAPAHGNGPIDPPMFLDFEPGWPEPPELIAPADQRTGQSTTATLTWEGGWWAHKYDIYLGTTSSPPLVVQDFMPGAATAGVQSRKEAHTFSGLAPGTTYYWRIVGKTMADRTRTSPIWSFTTSGTPPGGGSGTLSGHVIADAYVQAGSQASTNFGTTSNLIVKFSNDPQWWREGYLKLDIRSVRAGDAVALRLFGALSDTRQSSIRVAVHPVSNTTWTETGITWNNRPPSASSSVATFTVSGTSNRWYEVDITSYVQSQRSAGQDVVSLALRGTADTLPFAAFASRETSNGPQLVTGSSSASTASVAPAADAYVRAGPYASTNYGSARDLIVKFSRDPQWWREGYLKFDIGSVQAGQQVALRLYGGLSDTREPSIRVAVHSVSSTSWTESGITWNTKPPSSTTSLTVVTVSGTSKRWYEADITSYVQAERSAGRTVIALALRGTADTLPFAGFDSKEGANGAHLVIGGST